MRREDFERRLRIVEAHLDRDINAQNAVRASMAPTFGHPVLTPNPFEGAHERLLSALTPEPAGEDEPPTDSSLIPFAKRNGDLMFFASVVSDLDGRAHDLEFSLSRDAAFELRDNLNAILEDEPEIPVPHTSTFAAISDVAEALKDSLRPGGAAFAEALDLRLKARGVAHANRVFIDAFAGSFADPKPTWPQAMRMDAAARARDERSDSWMGA